MRRALTWLAGAVGLAALARHFSRRRTTADGPVVEDPAQELRAKLATQRVDEPETAAPDPAVEEEPDEVDAPVDLAERRAEVHARAQEAIDSMRDDAAPSDGPEDEPVA